MSRSIYNLVITFLLTELHCGYDFAWSPQNLVPFNLMAGSRRHHEHHRGGKRFYQKFFTYLDEISGTGASTKGVIASGFDAIRGLFSSVMRSSGPVLATQ
jgi:hypothetical protein